MAEQRTGRVGKFFSLTYPFSIAALSVYWALSKDISYDIPNFDKVLDGAITFSSIVVGFLGALLGILISIKDSEVVDTIFRTKEKTTIKIFFYEPFLLGLAVVVSSAFMHVMRSYKDNTSSDLTFYAWLLVTTWFVPSTFRVVNTFMSLFFVSNVRNSRPQSNVDEDVTRREERRERLRRSNNPPDNHQDNA